MVGMLDSCAVDREVEPRSCQTKDSKIGICCFSTKYAELRRKIRDWLARKYDKLFGLGDMYIRGLLFQLASTIKIELIVLV